ncbi:MAG: dTDP-4-dehydrorhamnose reductase [bacterium]|nr:dTDP-4-dehydrorhamnose reductase [bacterium]
MSRERPIPSNGIVVLGASGMLGRAWRELLEELGINSRFLGRDECDITDAASIRRAIDGWPIVVNCAAYTDVDGAEAFEDEATRINGEAVAVLGAACIETGARLVHYSTDYVFNGQRDWAPATAPPYRTDEPRDPVNAYGRSKAVGESLLEPLIDSGKLDALIIRTSWVYAPWGKNFVLTIAKLASERDELTVVNDQYGRPTSALGLAETTLTLLENLVEPGIWHATDGGRCAWFDFATAIAEKTESGCVVKPCGSDQFPRPAKRPAFSVLDLSETEEVIGPMSPWEDRLDQVLIQAGLANKRRLRKARK